MSRNAAVLRGTIWLGLLVTAVSPEVGLAESGPSDGSCFEALRKIVACDSKSSDDERQKCASEQLSEWGGSLTIQGDLRTGCKLPARSITATSPPESDEHVTGTSRAIAAASSEQTTPQTTPESPPPVEPQTSGADSFGAVSLPPAKQKKPPRSVVLVLKEYGIATNKKPFFDFENGQRWRQKSSDDGRLLKLDSLIGEEFTLRRGILGSYKMSPNSAGRSIKVYRVR